MHAAIRRRGTRAASPASRDAEDVDEVGGTEDAVDDAVEAAVESAVEGAMAGIETSLGRSTRWIRRWDVGGPDDPTTADTTSTRMSAGDESECRPERLHAEGKLGRAAARVGPQDGRMARSPASPPAGSRGRRATWRQASGRWPTARDRRLSQDPAKRYAGMRPDPEAATPQRWQRMAEDGKVSAQEAERLGQEAKKLAESVKLSEPQVKELQEMARKQAETARKVMDEHRDEIEAARREMKQAIEMEMQGVRKELERQRTELKEQRKDEHRHREMSQKDRERKERERPSVRTSGPKSDPERRSRREQLGQSILRDLRTGACRQARPFSI